MQSSLMTAPEKARTYLRSKAALLLLDRRHPSVGKQARVGTQAGCIQMLLAAILGEVLRAPSAGHEARLPPCRQSRRPLGGRLALSGVHSALTLRGGRGGGGGSTDGLRGGHSLGGENPPCRVRERKLVFVGAPFCEGQNLAGADLAPEALRRSGLKKAVESLGWVWEDEGDLDFASHFASKGIVWEKTHLASLQRYREWVASGMEVRLLTLP